MSNTVVFPYRKQINKLFKKIYFDLICSKESPNFPCKVYKASPNISYNLHKDD